MRDGELTGADPESVGEVGEFALIDRMVARLGPSRPDTVVGAGADDTAVLRLGDGRLILATVDVQVGGVHFLVDHCAPEDVGRKAAAVSLSDIAAMGGSPTHALASLSASADLPADYALRVTDGLVGELARWGAELVGGNLSRHDGFVLDVTLLGTVDDRHLLLRSGASPGDVLLVTGHIGAAAAGMALMTAEHDPAALAPEHRQMVLARQRWPEPRLEVAPLLRPSGATAAIDLSDGLASDVGHLCERSGVGVRIEADRLPIAPATIAVAEALGLDPLQLAIDGGEDYELLFSAPPEAAESIVGALASATRLPATKVGELTEAPERVLVMSSGGLEPLEGGWRHYG